MTQFGFVKNELLPAPRMVLQRARSFDLLLKRYEKN
jgi:hypothetical protein